MNWRIGSNVAVWFLVGIIIYSIIKNWGGGFWDASTWQIVAAIATWILALGVIFAFNQLRQARRSTNAQIAIGLFRELRDSETIEKLRSIYNLNLGDFENLQDDKKKEIDYVLDRFDTLGNLVTEGIIDKKLAIETYGGTPALRFWYKIKDYIRGKQDSRGYYGENFENFARLSLDYFKKAGIKVKFYKEGEEHKGIDLVTKLQEKDFHPRNLKEIKRDRKRNQGEV